MFEPHQWLVSHAKEYGYNPDHCQPASVDLCLNEVKTHPPIPDGWLRSLFVTLGILPKRFDYNRMVRQEPVDGHYEFLPGQFYLCSTLEYLFVPLTHCAFINMRSSLARQGLGHKMAGYIDPGFDGQVTLELETTVPIRVRYRDRVVQAIYARLTEPTTRPYSGKYKGQMGATEAYETAG